MSGKRGDRRRIASLVAMSVLVVSAAGCGKAEPRGWVKHDQKLIQVKGKVLVDGQPAPRATVLLHPVSTSSPAEGTTSPGTSGSSSSVPTPHGECDGVGEFELSTYNGRDGAPPGMYVVTVSWTSTSGREDADVVEEMLPVRYQNPQESDLRVEVREGVSELEPLQLTR